MPPEVTRSLGYALADWFETFLVHGPGDVQGQSIDLDEEFLSFVVSAYEVDARGRRVFDEAFLSRSKGRAKSELAGMIVCAEFIGPCRFDHWATDGETSSWGYAFELGEPVGRPVVYPFIRCMATEEGQAGNTYDNVTSMLEHLKNNHSEAFPAIDLGQRAQTSTRIFLATGGEIRPSTASSASKDGGKETFVVFDEPHLYAGRELRAMFDTVSRNARKRLESEPWRLQTSTMYAIGDDSVAEQTHRAHAAGKLSRLLFDHREAPDSLNPERAEDRLEGLRHCYGPAAAWMNLPAIVEDYRDPRIDRSDWLRYFWNRAQAGVSDLVDGAVWDALAVPGAVLDLGDQIALGFDGSTSDDCTALIGCRLSDSRLFTIKVWNAGNGLRVDRADVDTVLTATYEAYNVAMLFGDPNRWEPYFDVWSANWPKRIAEEWPGDRRTDRNVRLFLTALKDGSLSHDGGEILTRHIKNTALSKGRPLPASGGDQRGDSLSRHYLGLKKKGAGKIDAAWAAMLAVSARGWAIENGALNVLDVSESVW